VKREVNEWWFQPFYAGPSSRRDVTATSVSGVPDVIDAADLDTAFRRARMIWPTVREWRCLGRVDDKDREKSTRKDRGWRERIVRERKNNDEI